MATTTTIDSHLEAVVKALTLPHHPCTVHPYWTTPSPDARREAVATAFAGIEATLTTFQTHAAATPPSTVAKHLRLTNEAVSSAAQAAAVKASLSHVVSVASLVSVVTAWCRNSGARARAAAVVTPLAHALLDVSDHVNFAFHPAEGELTLDTRAFYASVVFGADTGDVAGVEFGLSFGDTAHEPEAVAADLQQVLRSGRHPRVAAALQWQARRSRLQDAMPSVDLWLQEVGVHDDLAPVVPTAAPAWHLAQRAHGVCLIREAVAVALPAAPPAATSGGAGTAPATSAAAATAQPPSSAVAPPPVSPAADAHHPLSAQQLSHTARAGVLQLRVVPTGSPTRGFHVEVDPPVALDGDQLRAVLACVCPADSVPPPEAVATAASPASTVCAAVFPAAAAAAAGDDAAVEVAHVGATAASVQHVTVGGDTPYGKRRGFLVRRLPVGVDRAAQAAGVCRAATLLHRSHVFTRLASSCALGAIGVTSCDVTLDGLQLRHDAPGVALPVGSRVHAGVCVVLPRPATLGVAVTVDRVCVGSGVAARGVGDGVPGVPTADTLLCEVAVADDGVPVTTVRLMDGRLPPGGAAVAARWSDAFQSASAAAPVCAAASAAGVDAVVHAHLSVPVLVHCLLPVWLRSVVCGDADDLPASAKRRRPVT